MSYTSETRLRRSGVILEDRYFTADVRRRAQIGKANTASTCCGVPLCVPTIRPSFFVTNRERNTALLVELNCPRVIQISKSDGFGNAIC